MQNEYERQAAHWQQIAAERYAMARECAHYWLEHKRAAFWQREAAIAADIARDWLDLAQEWNAYHMRLQAAA